MRVNLKHTTPSVLEDGTVDFLGTHPQYHLPLDVVERFESIAEEHDLTPYGLLRAVYCAVAYTGWYFTQDYRTGEWWLNHLWLPRIYPKSKPNFTRCATVRGVDTRVCSNLKRLHRLASFNGFPQFGFVQVRGVVYTSVRPVEVNGRWKWHDATGRQVT